VNGNRPNSIGPDPGRLMAIAVAIVVMVSVLLTVVPSIPLPARPETSRAPLVEVQDPIQSEAGVFRTQPRELGLAPDTRARSDVPLRTLASYQTLRAYPGAPPRVPHGVTEAEFRGTLCNTCHQRGGYVERFGRYAPVTPHPEFPACLQCHPVDAMRVGVARPDDRPNVVCTQCHVDPDRPPPSLISLDWKASPFPGRAFHAMDGSPPVIPHDLQMRGNCLACHGGPGAVKEIRTTHPERANCRQCHATAETAEPFVRAIP